MLSDRKKIHDLANQLDEKVPNWYLRINVEKLNMEIPSKCILGQLAEEGDYCYWDVAKRLGFWDYSLQEEENENERLFATHTDWWRDEIYERQNSSKNS